MNNAVLKILMLSVISENIQVLWYNFHINLIIVVKNREIEYEHIRSNKMENNFDNVNWHFDDAYDGYCKRFNCEENRENSKHIKAGVGYAATHMGMYIAWIIKHNLEGSIHSNYSKEDLAKVRNEQMTGVEFLLKNCDGKLWSEDFNQEGLEFTKGYYDYYLRDYPDLVLSEFDTEYTIYEVEDNWDNYESIGIMLDTAYSDFKEGKVRRVR